MEDETVADVPVIPEAPERDLGWYINNVREGIRDWKKDHPDKRMTVIAHPDGFLRKHGITQLDGQSIDFEVLHFHNVYDHTVPVRDLGVDEIYMREWDPEMDGEDDEW